MTRELTLDAHGAFPRIEHPSATAQVVAQALLAPVGCGPASHHHDPWHLNFDAVILWEALPLRFHRHRVSV